MKLFLGPLMMAAGAKPGSGPAKKPATPTTLVKGPAPAATASRPAPVQPTPPPVTQQEPQASLFTAPPKSSTGGAIVSGFRIEKHVPIPENLRKDRESKYPLENLAIGHSFFIPGAKQSSVSSTVSAMAKKIYLKTKNKVRFIARERTEELDGKQTKGVRVWRIDPGAAE